MDPGAEPSARVLSSHQLPPPPPPGVCVWDSAKGAGPPDTKTACKAMAPHISVTSTLAGTHAALPNVTHVDIQTVLYRTEPELVDAKKSRISVAAIPAGGCSGCNFHSSGAKNCSEQLALIELAGQKGADVAVLPEEFLWDGQTAPPADCDMSPGQNCSIINALGAIAKKHSMYIVFGVRAAQQADDPYEADPLRPKAYGKLGYNTDVILDREGEMVGYYQKAWPCCPAPDGTTMDDGYPSRELVKTFDLDFGRVGLQTVRTRRNRHPNSIGAGSVSDRFRGDLSAST